MTDTDYEALARGVALLKTLQEETNIEGDALVQTSDIETLSAALEAAAVLTDRMQKLEERNLESAILARGWMEAHDKLHAGKPYKFPAPADKDELRARIAALEAAERIAKPAVLGGDGMVMVPRDNLKEIHDEINALGGNPRNEIEAAENNMVAKCLAIIERYQK